MPADGLDHVEIIIAGRAHSGWSRYEVDSDLLTPADAWSVSIDQERLSVPSVVRDAVTAQIKVGGDLVMTGYVDARAQSVRRGVQRLDLRGRDAAALLLDCSAPIFSAQDLTLGQVLTKIVRPLGISRMSIQADTQLLRDRVSIEPGETAWSALQRAAEANGLWPWFEPDGTLVVGGPDYSVPPVANLVMRRDGQGNNVIEATESALASERFSEVTVLGQAHGTVARDGRNAIKAVVRDTGMTVHRPRVLVDHEATNETLANVRARKEITDARVRGYELTLLVQGHRTAAGALWTPGQRVHVEIEDLGINGVFFLMARRFTGLPQFTTLTLREDGAWVLYARPKSLKHKKVKGKKPAAVIVDVTGGVQ